MVKLVSKGEAEEAPVASVKAGDYLFREGEAAQDMILVQDGTIELIKTEGGDLSRLGLLEAGDFAGEGAMLDGTPHSCSARAVTAAKVIRLDGSLLVELLRRDPEIGLRMVRRLSRRLQRSMEVGLTTARAGTSAVSIAPVRVTGSRPAVKGPVPARLVHEGGTEFRLPLDRDALVGREDPSTGFTPDIVLSPVDSQRSLSRRHATIAREGEDFVLREEPGVRNGTFVNGKRVKAGGSAKLKDGDEVSFGLIKTTFRVG